MNQKRFKLHLTNQIILALFCGAIFGWILHNYEGLASVSIALQIGSDIFMRTLRMMVTPIVLVSIICGVAVIGDPARLGRIGLSTIAFYLFTTIVAVSLAVSGGLLFGVGKGAHIPSTAEYSTKSVPTFSEIIVGIVPANPFQALNEGAMLQIIFFGLLLGYALAVNKESASLVLKFFEQTNTLLLKLVVLLMKIAPVGVFCVVALVFAKQGLAPVFSLLHYFLAMLILLFFHAVVIYGGLLKFVARLNPFRFYANARPAIATAFGTASSNATIPVTLETAEVHQGVSNSIASFTIPLGATINMDGTAIMQGVATVFIAHASGAELSLTQILTVIGMATLASIGTAGVPGAGMITLAMVLKQVGLPEQGILLLLPVDRLLDMVRTAVNVTGDLVVTCIVAKREKLLDQKVFDAPLRIQYEKRRTE